MIYNRHVTILLVNTNVHKYICVYIGRSQEPHGPEETSVASGCDLHRQGRIRYRHGARHLHRRQCRDKDHHQGRNRY